MTVDIFSSGEKKLYLKIKKSRNTLFRPLCKLLAGIGISANMLSYLGVASMIGFAYNISTNLMAAFGFLLGHLFLDALDGPLATYTKNTGGMLVDLVCDHVAFLIFLAGLVIVGFAPIKLVTIFVIVYALLICSVIKRNKMRKPIKFVVKGKMILYLIFSLLPLFGINWIFEGIIVLTILKIPPILTSIFLILKVYK